MNVHNPTPFVNSMPLTVNNQTCGCNAPLQLVLVRVLLRMMHILTTVCTEFMF